MLCVAATLAACDSPLAREANHPLVIAENYAGKNYPNKLPEGWDGSGMSRATVTCGLSKHRIRV